MQITPAPYVTLPNGVKMPQLGLGTWPMSDAEAMISVEAALNMGYRLIDTAEIYANAYKQDADFYSFYRSLNAYRGSFNGANDIIVLQPDSEFFQFFKKTQ